MHHIASGPVAATTNKEPGFDAGFSEALLDQLFNRGVSGKLLAQYQRDETQTIDYIRRISNGQGISLPLGAREVCLLAVKE